MHSVRCWLLSRMQACPVSPEAKLHAVSLALHRVLQQQAGLSVCNIRSNSFPGCRDLTETVRSAEEWSKQVVQFGHTETSVQVLPAALSDSQWCLLPRRHARRLLHLPPLTVSSAASASVSIMSGPPQFVEQLADT